MTYIRGEIRMTELKTVKDIYLDYANEVENLEGKVWGLESEIIKKVYEIIRLQSETIEMKASAEFYKPKGYTDTFSISSTSVSNSSQNKRKEIMKKLVEDIKSNMYL
jgi:hypothetical protein